MKYKRVEKIDYDFSVIGYGCWGASGSNSWTGHTDSEQIAAMQSAIDMGINFFDVAPIYGMGHAEEVLGKAIKGNRANIFIATKVGLPWNKKFEARNDVSYKSIITEIDQSLKRLNLENVDLLQVHWPTDSGIPLEETIKAMKEIQESGKTKYIGLSNFSVEDAIEANEIVDIVSMQGLYNMLEHNSDSYHNIPLKYRVLDEVFPYVTKNSMAFFPYSPLFQGLLTGKIRASSEIPEQDVRYNNPKLGLHNRAKYLTILENIRSIKELENKPLNEIAINYLVAQKEVTSIISTVKDSNELNSNLKALDWEMTNELVTEINKLVEQINE